MFGLLLVWVLASCSGAQTEVPASGTVDSASATAAAIPEGVLVAREAVLTFLREGANECVPPENAAWTAVDRSATAPSGFDVYQFKSGECTTTITVAENSGAEALYHVALGDGVTGFCWQAVVDAKGNILLTGEAAQTDKTLGNPAQAYCEAQGYDFEIVTLANGSKCGKCMFDNGRSCNAWAFFHGVCTPENAPAE